MSKLAKNERLTSFQLFALITVGAISITGFTMPQAVGKAAGTDGWISVLLAGILYGLGIFLVINLSRRFPGQTIFSFSRVVLGKHLSYVVNLMYMVYNILIVAVVCRIYLEMTYYSALQRTPILILAVIILALCAYAACQGLLTVARVSEFALYLIVGLGTILSGLIPYSALSNFLPIGVNGIKNILAGIPPALPSFLGFQLLFVALPQAGRLQTVKLPALLGTVFVTVYNLSIFFAIIAYFGIERTLMFLWPSLQYVKPMLLPVVERVDIVILLLWALVMLASAIIYFYVAQAGLRETFGMKLKLLPTAVVFAVCLYLIMRPRNNVEVEALNAVTETVGIAADFVVPLLLYLIALVRQRGRTV